MLGFQNQGKKSFVKVICFYRYVLFLALSVSCIFYGSLHFMVLSNPSTAQDSWSAGLVQILHLTPVQSHSKLSVALEKKKTQTVHVITQFSLSHPELCSSYVCFKKHHPPTSWEYLSPSRQFIYPHHYVCWFLSP